MSAHRPVHPFDGRGRHRLELPSHRFVPGEENPQIGEAPLELPGPVGQGPGVPGGASIVFQTPPEDTATGQVAGSVGSFTASEMRPDVKADPIPRSSRPSKGLGGQRTGGVLFGRQR